MKVLDYYCPTEFWKKYFCIWRSIFSILHACFVLIDFSLGNKKWNNCILQVTDYTRDLEEMQTVSREEYLASLRR